MGRGYFGQLAGGIHKLKARIELICDYRDLHTIDEFIKHCKESK